VKVGKLQFVSVVGAFFSMLLHLEATAADWRSFNGEYAISAEPLSDPIPGGEDIIYIVVKGSAAKAMFDRMKSSPAEKDACGDERMVMKISENLVCTKKEKDYRCNFGIDPRSGGTKIGYTC